VTIYLDHAATTPMVPAAIEAMTAELGVVGNPSSLHAAGRRARRVVEESREQIAAALGARPSEVVLTAGGTESDNLAVKGTYAARVEADPRRRRILVSAIEHHAVLDSVQWLTEHGGAEAVWLPVDRFGRVDLEVLRAEIDKDPASVAMVSVMWANNEVGTLQPVADIVAIAHEHGIPVHTDAVQAVGQVPVSFADCGVDLLTFTGHKLGGPLGVGALLAVRGASLTPLLHGGGQERQVRSGTLDTPSVRGFAVATDIAVRTAPVRSARLSGLRDRLVAERARAGSRFGAARRPGSRRPASRQCQFRLPGLRGRLADVLLDAQGVECSTGSACQAGVPQPSHVLQAMGVPEQVLHGSLRLTLATPPRGGRRHSASGAAGRRGEGAGRRRHRWRKLNRARRMTRPRQVVLP
jgi:cysteine desulfurase